MKVKLSKLYYIYYHLKGEGEENQIKTIIEAESVRDAAKKAKKEFGKEWIIEKVRRMW